MDLNLEELKNGDYCNAGKIVGTDQYYFEDIDGRYCSVFTEISKEEFDTFEDWGNSLSDQRKKSLGE